MVYPGQHIPGLEEEWLVIMGPRKSYAFSTFNLRVYEFIPRSCSGCGKKHSVVRGFSTVSVVENSCFG
jgi:hypothetical protein